MRERRRVRGYGPQTAETPEDAEGPFRPTQGEGRRGPKGSGTWGPGPGTRPVGSGLVLEWISAWALSFLVGSIPWGWVVTRRRGIDIRQVGSGNIGATNVVRALGVRWGLLVLVLDMLKGFLPVLAVRLLAPDRPVEGGWAAASVVAGHMFTPWLRFRGGKGVATAVGAFSALAPWATLMAFGVFLIVFSLTWTVSVASLSAALAFGIFYKFLFDTAWSVFAPAGLVVLLIWVRHKDNLRRLLRGQEPRLRWGSS